MLSSIAQSKTVLLTFDVPTSGTCSFFSDKDTKAKNIKVSLRQTNAGSLRAEDQTRRTSSLLLFLQQLVFQFLNVVLQFGILHHQFLFFSDTGLDHCNKGNSRYFSVTRVEFQHLPGHFRTAERLCFTCSS